MNEKILRVHSKKIKKAFQTYDVTEYDKLYVEGSSFPICDENTQEKVNELKEPLSIEEMIFKLKEHGITFSEQEYIDAIKILKTINYYRLSVFCRYVKENSSFSQLFKLYRFDAFLRESVNRLIPPIEIAVKTSLAHFLSINYYDLIDHQTELKRGLVYLDKKIYKEECKKAVPEMLSQFAEFIESKKTKDPVIKHHVKKYGGNIPIWVLVEQLTMGNITTFVTYLDRSIRKKWVREFINGISVNGVDDKWIIEWLKTIQILRNYGAHCSRFYGCRLNFTPTFLKEHTDYFLKTMRLDFKQLDKLRHTFFAGLIIIKYFYLTLPEFEQAHWNVFLDKLESRIDEYSADLYRIGFPNEWQKILRIDN